MEDSWIRDPARPQAIEVRMYGGAQQIEESKYSALKSLADEDGGRGGVTGMSRASHLVGPSRKVCYSPIEFCVVQQLLSFQDFLCVFW